MIMVIILEISQIYHYILLHHNHNNHKIVFVYPILLYYDLTFSKIDINYNTINSQYYYIHIGETNGIMDPQ